MTADTKTHWERRFDPANTDVQVLEPDHPSLTDPAANIACSYNGTDKLHMLLKSMPEPHDGEVVVHVRATGICGSDVHFWKHGAIGCSVLSCDVGAGHESAGEVVAVPPNSQWRVGDRVAIEAGVPCSDPACDACRSGAYNHCPHMVFHSSPPYHGTLTRFLAHPAAWLHALPEGVSFEEGALCEPLSVALAAVERAGLKLGDGVLICGAGPIGLMSLVCARAAGCTPIVITDIVESRLAFAAKLVPHVRTVLASGVDVAAKVREAAAGSPIRVAIECTGHEGSIDTAIHSVAPRGTVMIVGVGPNKSSYAFDHCSRNEIVLTYLFRYAHQYPKAIRLIADGIIDVKPFITHRFPLAEAISAFQTAADPTSGSIKVQIKDE